MRHATGLIADDEPLLRERLRAHLTALWPELVLTDDARNGLEALALFEQHRPHIVFLDIHMPGLSGIDTARALNGHAHLVFVTAYEQYALQAFEQGAIDYLVKPIDSARLAHTVERLKRQLAGPIAEGAALDLMLDRLARRLEQRVQSKSWLQWIKASVGNSVRLIPVEQVQFLRADDKYTLVVWDEGEALIRKSIRELAEQLDPERFVQTHRSVIVNLRCVIEVIRGVNETAELHLRGRSETLPVSRNYLCHFRQM
ncbi:LytR/AlgR family response regulator transcription factor [Undibacterium terreum]|uniref:DNA-binding response regulator n=1 Tax=Undibacterium terreum TaxID=1224302 RepID=A0A916XRZ3_9BURK|nr:LytTR family DNA-binding domain-containing protein [Undibacterium terreum]GGD00686.1 DNA-binding response regulator [Undibacterium terreum]